MWRHGAQSLCRTQQLRFPLQSFSPRKKLKMVEQRPTGEIRPTKSGGIRLDFGRCLCIGLCMRFKTISLSEDAYKILKMAKRSRRESFTEVVRRASWDEPADTMGEALDLLESEFGRGKTTVTAEELETSRKLHAQRKTRA
jgi:hypothetical protein